MDAEALVRGLALRVAVGEGLERLRAAVARVADRREEERLEHPRARAVDEVRAGDEHGVVGRRACRELRRAREEIRRPVLHRAEQRAVVVVVQLPPDPPLLLGLLDPAALVGLAAVARLPPDAPVADGRRRLERRAGHPRETGAQRRRPDLVDDDVDPFRLDLGHPLEIVADAELHRPPDLGDGRAPGEAHVQLDRRAAVLGAHANALPAGQRALREAEHAVDLAHRVRRVPREDVGGDRGVPLHVSIVGRRTLRLPLVPRVPARVSKARLSSWIHPARTASGPSASPARSP